MDIHFLQCPHCGVAPLQNHILLMQVFELVFKIVGGLESEVTKNLRQA